MVKGGVAVAGHPAHHKRTDMEREETRKILIVQAKAYGVPEALLENLSIASLQKIVDYERDAEGFKGAPEKV